MHWHAVARSLLCAAATLSVSSMRSPAQTNADVGSEYTITTLQPPKGATFGTGDGKLWFLRKRELIRLDQDQNRLVTTPIDDIQVRTWIVSGGSLWIFGKSESGWNIRRIDPQSGKLVSTIPLENNRDQQFLYAYGSIWVWTGFVLARDKPVLRIDPETKKVIEIRDKFKGQVLAGDGKIWMLGVEDGDVQCLDPQSNKIVDGFSVGRGHDNGVLKGAFKGGSYSYVIGDGVLWVGETRGQNGGKYVLSGYDLKTHQQVATLEQDASLFPPVAWSGYVWLSSRGDPKSGHYITRVDPRAHDSVGQIFIPISPNAARDAEFLPPMLLPSEDSLWAVSGRWFSNDHAMIVRRIQAKQGAADR